MGGRNTMETFSRTDAVAVSKRSLNAIHTSRLICCFICAALLVLVSTALPRLSSAGTNTELTLVDGDLLPESLLGTYFEEGQMGTEPHVSEDSWPMFRHDLNHTGYSTSHVPDNPSVHWTFQAVDGFESSPVVEYGMVFIGSDDHNVYALDENTGELVWNFTTEGYVIATPAVADGRVFFGSAMDGKFYSLDAFTGDLVWTFDRPSVMDVWTTYKSSPAIDEPEGRVYTGAKISNRDTGDKHQEFFCLNMTTGEMVWNLTEPHGAGQGSSPAISGDAVFSSLGERMLSLDKRTGNILWEYPTTGSISFSSPTVADGTVFIQTNEEGSLIALDEHDGSLKWSYDFSRAHSGSSPAYHNGVIFVGSMDYNVYAFDAVTGDVIWKYKTDKAIHSSPAVADGKIVIASGDQYLYVLNENDGSLVWRTYLGGLVSPSSPTVSNGRIFVSDGHVAPRGNFGTLFAFGPPPRSIDLDIDPDTLNLNSKGRWITAYLTTENAKAEDIDPSSLLLNDVIPPAWWNVQNETTLMVKFDRSAVQAILPVSNAVDIKIAGQWKDGETFEVHDIIRVIDVGGHMESPWSIHSREGSLSHLRIESKTSSAYTEIERPQTTLSEIDLSAIPVAPDGKERLSHYSSKVRSPESCLYRTSPIAVSLI